MFSILLDLFHVGFIFVPLGLIFVPLDYISFKMYHLLLLVYTLTPIHWYYLNDQCIVTYISKKLGGLKETKTTSPFSERWLWWLYKPLMWIFNYDYNSENLNNMVYNYSVFNIILMWGLVYYKATL